VYERDLGGSPASSTAGLDRSVHDNALSGRHVLDGDYSEAFGELMAARALALPTLARSAIRTSGSVHLPVASASDDGKDGHRFNLQMLGY
jgi:hypothetical protein